MKTYLELPHMLPVTVRTAGEPDKVWIEQTDPYDDEPDAVLIDRAQVRQVIEALEQYLADNPQIGMGP